MEKNKNTYVQLLVEYKNDAKYQVRKLEDEIILGIEEMTKKEGYYFRIPFVTNDYEISVIGSSKKGTIEVSKKPLRKKVFIVERTIYSVEEFLYNDVLDELMVLFKKKIEDTGFSAPKSEKKS